MQPARFRRAVLSALLAGALLSSACSGDDDDASAGAAATSGVGSGGKGGRSGGPSDRANAGEDSEGPVAQGGSADGGSMAGQPAAGGSGAPHFPCDVEDVIVAKCQRCHNDPQLNGAPFPLLTWEDTRKPYGMVLVFEAMLPAIDTDFMPLTQLVLEPPVEPLEPEEKELMLEWLGSGAPAVLGPACD